MAALMVLCGFALLNLKEIKLEVVGSLQNFRRAAHCIRIAFQHFC